MKRRGHMAFYAAVLLLILLIFPDQVKYLIDSIARGETAMLVLAGLVAIVIFQRAQ